MSGRAAGTARSRLLVLVGAQVAGGVGVAVGIAAGGLLAQRVSGSTSLSGLAQTASVLGAAVAAVPLARLAVRHGRRMALVTGFGVAAVGAALLVLATLVSWFPLLLLAAFLFGGGTASGLQARYAATDGLPAAQRGRALSVVVWATTVGAVAGPNLAVPVQQVDRLLRLPQYSGAYVLAGAAFVVAASILALGLRPAPASAATAVPATAGALPTSPAAPAPAPVSRPSTAAVLGEIWHRPGARLGVAAMAVSHAVMVGVMVMTPLHLAGHGASFEVVGLVISAHIAGMYAASPLFGWLADTRGARTGVACGAFLLLLALLTAGLAGSSLVPTASPGAGTVGVGAGLVLLGLGWSASLVSGSALVATAFDDGAGADDGADAAGGAGRRRAAVDIKAVQGGADLVMGLTGAAAGALAGVVLAAVGYPGLSGVALLPLLGLAWVAAVDRAARRKRLAVVPSVP